MKTTNLEEVYTLKQAGEKLGVPTQVLRRFCNAGLIRRVGRTKTGYRVLNKEQLERAHRLVYLRRCGFSMAELRDYIELEERGSETIAKRKALLETKKRQIWQILEDCQENIDFIERQIELFDREML